MVATNAFCGYVWRIRRVVMSGESALVSQLHIFTVWRIRLLELIGSWGSAPECITNGMMMPYYKLT
jgi:hypothetical protein